MVTAISAGFLFLGSILSLALGPFPVNGPMSVLAFVSGLVLIVQLILSCLRQISARFGNGSLIDFITPPRANSIKEDSDHDSSQ